MLFCGTRLPTPLRHHQHHPLQAAAVAAPVNASNVEFNVNTGSNKSSFSKDWPDMGVMCQLDTEKQPRVGA